MIALAAALAAAVAPPGPVDFTAQTMRMEPRERRTLLDGSVRLSRGGMVVTGDRAVVEFAPDEPLPSQPQRKARRRGRDEPALLGQKLERFTVDGNVHVQRAHRLTPAPASSWCTSGRSRPWARSTRTSCESSAIAIFSPTSTSPRSNRRGSPVSSTSRVRAS